MLHFEDKILIETRGNVKKLLEEWLKEFPIKVDILNTYCKKNCSLITHTLSFSGVPAGISEMSGQSF